MGKKKIRKVTRDEIIGELATDEFDKLDSGDLINVLIEGCEGWNNKTDEELVECAMNQLDETIEIVEG